MTGRVRSFLAVAEPVHQHLLAGHFVLPDLGRHVVDEALADPQAALVGVVVDAVGHAIRVGGDGAVPGDQRPVARGHAGWAGGASIGRVGVAFAEGVQPDHFFAQGDGFREQRGVAGEGQAQAGLHQIVLEAAGVAGMRHDGSQIGHDLFTADRRAELLCQAIQEGALDVGRGGLVVGPERKDAPAAPVIVMQVAGMSDVKLTPGPFVGVRSCRGRQENLLVREVLPEGWP